MRKGVVRARPHRHAQDGDGLPLERGGIAQVVYRQLEGAADAAVILGRRDEDSRRLRHEFFEHIGVFRVARLSGQGQVQIAQMDAVYLEIALSPNSSSASARALSVLFCGLRLPPKTRIKGVIPCFFDYAATPAGSGSTMGLVSLRSGRTSLPKISASSLCGHPFMMKCRTPAS